MSTPGFLRLDDGSIHHIVAVHSEGRYTLYVDGTQVGSWTHLNTDATFEFRDNSGFAIFDLTLTEEQLAEHNEVANASSTGTCRCNLRTHVPPGDPNYGKSYNCPNDAMPERLTCRDCWECVP